ncbi:MAG: ArsR family transcriptional regulator [Methanosarcinales archaeon]|nr:ArsR family transcriptional regulator [Methanosarcinales archaeon]
MNNAMRRKVMALLTEGKKTREEISGAVGPAMLDYHLSILEGAKLVHIQDDGVALTDFGMNFMQGKSEKPRASADLKGAKPVDVVEVRQLLPCIADKSRFRIIARMEPPLGKALSLLEPLFPRGRYSDSIGSLIIQKGTVLITLYGTGNVTMTMIKDQEEAMEILEGLSETINRAIASGVTPAPRERVRIDPLEVNRYLPGTNCRECGEQSCYSFAIRLANGEVPVDSCPTLHEDRYAVRLEHLRALMAYL